ncbi:MAG: hypothetical protein KGZ25_01685, partial [Planctomycetes bacterium]|nr:hypothetical protein [Planctomycetota bacterium]
MKVHFYLSLLLIFALAATAPRAAEKNPAALIYGGIHEKYVARPLHARDIEFDTCTKTENLQERLKSGKFNVLVAVKLLGQEGTQVAQKHLARGGGLLILAPSGNHHHTEKWTAMNRWLTDMGARPRWEVLKETDPANRVTDMMGVGHSFTDRLKPPASKGVKGVLIMMLGNPGAEPVMPFEFSEKWDVVVRGAKSLKTVITEHHSKGPHLQPWIPEKPIDSGPAFMGILDFGGGRIAVTSLRPKWSFTAPGHCPTVEVMMTKGEDGKPSDWVGVLANTIRWLAKPSLKKGMGGAKTPKKLLHRPRKKVKKLGPKKWKGITVLKNRPQTPGLIGARTKLSSGSGTVSDYVEDFP